MLLEILKAFIIGICASAPLGPVAILVLQRTICYGQKAGFATGLGASLVDTAYAIISIFAWAFAQNFINTYESIIFLIGGPVIALLGYSMAFKDPFRKMEPGDDKAMTRGASPTRATPSQAARDSAAYSLWLLPSCWCHSPARDRLSAPC